MRTPLLPLRLVAAAGLAALAAVPAATFAGDDDRPLPAPTAMPVGFDDSLARIRSLYPNAQVVAAETGRHGNRWTYLFRTFRGTTVRTTKIDCSNGQIIVNRTENVRGQRLSNLRREVRVIGGIATTRAEAIQAALAALPGAAVHEVEFDDFNDQPVWKVKLLDGTRRITIIVGASSGVVIPQPNDGVVNVSFDDAVGKAESIFAGWSVVKIEIEDSRSSSSSGSAYNLRLVNAAGNQRRDVRLDANSAAVLRDRIRSDSDVSENARLAAANPAVSFGKAAMIAAETVTASRVHEVELDFEHGVLVYEVELFRADGTLAKVYVNATTGQASSTAPVGGGGGGGGGNPTDPGTGSPVTSTQAAAIALARVPGTTVREITTDFEDGVQVYEVKLVNSAGQRTDVHVAIATGAITRVRVR